MDSQNIYESELKESYADQGICFKMAFWFSYEVFVTAKQLYIHSDIGPSGRQENCKIESLTNYDVRMSVLHH